MNKMNYLVDTLLEKAKTCSDQVLFSFIDYDEEIEKWILKNHTIGELYHKALETAHMLRKKGLQPDDRAIIFSMQDFGTIAAVYGCMMAGVTFIILPPPLDEDKTERLISVLKSCQPRALISNYRLEQQAKSGVTGRLLREAFRETIRLKRIYTDRLDPYRRQDVIVPAKPEKLVYLQYTSGSTSSPKGVRVTWKNLMKNLEQCLHCYDFTNVSLATWVPFFHNLGLVVTICMPLLAVDSRIYYLHTMRFLENPKLWIRMISDFRITLTVGPGSAYDVCTRIFSEEEAAANELSFVELFMNGSEFISPKSVSRFTELFQCMPNAMCPGYGLAENVCLATFARQDYRTLKLDYDAYQKNRAVIVPDSTGTGNETDRPDEKPGTPSVLNEKHIKEIVSVGAPVKDLTVVVGNPKTGRVYPDLRIGEIFIAGDSVADGYWGNHRDNRNFHTKMQGYDLDFYKTGDLGFLYQGHLYITGRIKEMLIVNGHNIYPSDIQMTVYRKIPALQGSAVGFFSCIRESKEHLIAVVESAPTADFNRLVHDINAAVSERFGFSFYDIIFVPRMAIPRTDNGKLQILKARTLYQEGRFQILHSSHDHRASNPRAHLISRSIERADELFDRSIERADELIDRSLERADGLIDWADDILVQVHDTFQKVLKLEQFSLTDSFLELGGDSLTGFELVSNMEQKFHIKLDFRELLRDASVVGVTKYIHNVLSGVTGAGKSVDLSKECHLDKQIRPNGDYKKPPADCRRIFLTGATGFLGAQLIRSMWEYYPHDGLAIYCLVRADFPEAGLIRLRQNMEHYQCWEEELTAVLHPVTGDLSAPKLGISEAIWKELADTVEVIYHNGAILNFVFPYEYLKSTNVNGTIETLRLACEGQPKYYHYVSSYSVYDTPDNRGKRVMEDDSLNNWRGFSLSYSETKWVSEKLVKTAGKRGLKAAIYRPGDITGAANGIWEMDDMVSRMLVSIVQMKGVPRARYSFHMTPVDYVGKALIYLSRKEEVFDHAFNLINPKYQSLREIVNDIRSCGYTVRHIPFPVWKSRIRRSDASDNAMVLLECLFEAGNESNPNILRHFMGKDPVYDTSNAKILLGQSGITCPPVDREMIAAYLNYFKSRGYLQSDQ